MNAQPDPEPLPLWPDLMATLAGLLIFGSCGWAAASSVAGVWSGEPKAGTSVSTVATLR